jgi:hypothetical protein
MVSGPADALLIDAAASSCARARGHRARTCVEGASGARVGRVRAASQRPGEVVARDATAHGACETARWPRATRLCASCPCDATHTPPRRFCKRAERRSTALTQAQRKGQHFNEQPQRQDQKQRHDEVNQELGRPRAVRPRPRHSKTRQAGALDEQAAAERKASWLPAGCEPGAAARRGAAAAIQAWEDSACKWQARLGDRSINEDRAAPRLGSRNVRRS